MLQLLDAPIEQRAWKLISRVAEYELFDKSTKATFKENIHATNPGSEKSFMNIGELEPTQFADGDGKYTFKIVWSGRDFQVPVTVTFKQTSWPTTSQISGFEEVDVQGAFTKFKGKKAGQNFKGIGKSNQKQCIIDGNGPGKGWWNCIAPVHQLKGGIPGPGGKIAAGVETYVWSKQASAGQGPEKLSNKSTTDEAAKGADSAAGGAEAPPACVGDKRAEAAIKETILTGICDELEDEEEQALCRKDEEAVGSDVDPSVVVAEGGAAKAEITVEVTEEEVLANAVQYVQFTSDKYRNPTDFLILVPIDAQPNEETERQALRKVSVPPINDRARRLDTAGLVSLHLNPDLSPSAEARVEYEPVPPGAYRLAYVRELVEDPALRYMRSPAFAVVPSPPTQPGRVEVEKRTDDLLLSWAPPRFDGGAKVGYTLSSCALPNCSSWDHFGEGVEEPKLALRKERAPQHCREAPGCLWRAIAVNEQGYSLPGWASDAGSSVLAVDTETQPGSPEGRGRGLQPQPVDLPGSPSP